MLFKETIDQDTLKLLKKIQSLEEFRHTRLVGLAGLKDIAAMKLSAITNRGTKKDFIDFYFLLQIFSIDELLNFYVQKYSADSLFTVLKSITYFDDAEGDPMPIMLKDIRWSEIKSFISESVSEYL